METLGCCTNCLPGAEPNVTPQQTKNMIFDSKSLVTNALAELAQFMANEQSFANDKDKGKKKEGNGNKTKESHCGGSHNRGCGKGRRKRQDCKDGRGVCGGNHQDDKCSKKGPVLEDECPVHGGHIWHKCNQSPRGDNCNPARGGGQDGQGRGGTNPGCGNHGQGDGQGSRNNNNNNNNNNNYNHGDNHGKEHHHMDGALQQGTANTGQGANQQHNDEHHHLDVIGDPPPAGQGAMPGWQGQCN
jgi:uncharacterized low-complexity protein